MTRDKKKWPAPIGSRKQARDFGVPLNYLLYPNGRNNTSINRGFFWCQKRGDGQADGGGPVGTEGGVK